VKAMHVLTTLQGWASDVMYGDPKGATYEESIGATEDQFGYQHLAVGCCSKLKTWPQDSGESLQKFTTAIEQLTHCAFPALHEA
jgi:hypothetical protein